MDQSKPCSEEPPLWRHQRDEVERYWWEDGRALLWGMRTGKTRAIIKTAERLHAHGEIDGVLVFAPNGVHTNWVRRELPSWSAGFRGAAWSSALSRAGSDATRGLLDRDGPLRYLAVNDEALINPRCVDAINAFRATCGRRILAVWDESSLFRRPGAKRTQYARGLAQRCDYNRILDGTALVNSPLHAFSQFELLGKSALGFTRFEDFKARYAVFVRRRRGAFGRREYAMLDRYVNMDELRERLARWSSVVLRGDCDDMPALLPVEREVVMSDAQRAHYLRMVMEMLTEVGDREVTASNGGARVLKLQQILGGFVIDGRGDVVSVDDDPPILRMLEREVLGTDGKAIVWCRFQEDIRRVCHRLREAGRVVVEYHGGVPTRQREESIDRFMTDGRVTVFVGQPQAGGRGLNLSAASAVMWYSSTPDAIITEQGNERATMKGGGSVDIVTFATRGTVHDDIVASNQRKVSLADSVSGSGLRDLLARTSV